MVAGGKFILTDKGLKFFAAFLIFIIVIINRNIHQHVNHLNRAIAGGLEGNNHQTGNLYYYSARILKNMFSRINAGGRPEPLSRNSASRMSEKQLRTLVVENFSAFWNIMNKA